MIIYCNANHGIEPTVMEQEGHGWHYLNGKPSTLTVQLQCPVCHAVLRIELPIIYYKGGN